MLGNTTMTSSKKQRTVAVINLFVGAFIGVVLVGAAIAGREGQFVLAIGTIAASFLLLAFRIHRVFQVID